MRRDHVLVNSSVYHGFLSHMQITATARRLREEKSIGAVFIDCLDVIEPDDRRAYRADQVALISRRLKTLAKELAVPVVISARLARASDKQDQRPRATDLRHNGAIEHDADKVLFLHRPEYHDPGQQEGVVEVIVTKQRNGPTGDVTITFINQFMRFENFAVEEPFGYAQ
jgi:replicative DNA helicase